MLHTLKKTYYRTGAAITAGMIFAAEDAHAQAAGNTFSDIAQNVNDSIASLPGLVTGISYLCGLMLGILGILKIKDHVENPGNTKLKDGVVRLVVGGGLFALPILFDAMFTTVNADASASTKAAKLNKVEFNVQ